MAIYDLTQLKEISGGDEGFIQNILETFSTDMPQMLSDLEKAYRDNDMQGVGKMAHKMKSSIDFMGIESIKKTIRSIERQGKTESDDSLQTDIEEVRRVIEQVIEDLNV